MSWDDLRPAENVEFKKTQDDQDELARIVMRVFATESGQELMQWLQKTYVDVPVAVPGADPSFAFYAEGCRNVVRDLQRRMDHARNL